MTKYRAFSIDKSGNRMEITGESIIVEIAEDRRFELVINPHKNFFGGLPVVALLNSRDLVGNDTSPIINIKPGASNVVHLSIEVLKNTKKQ